MSKTEPKQYWLMKSEPEVFSFSDLLAAPKQTTFWEGVRNYQARNFMRDQMRVGDGVLFYHSNAGDETGVAGIAEVVKVAYPDASAFDPKSEYFDPDAKKKGVNPWVMVDVKAVRKFSSVVTRDQLAAQAKLKDMMVLKKGSRLSIQPVTAQEFSVVEKLGT